MSIEQVASWETLLKAHQLARRGKRKRPEVMQFEADLFNNLANIQNELITGTYQISERRNFTVFEPQKRFITASAYRDRVAQHAVFLIYTDQLERKMVADTYACRPGKGTHAAAVRVQGWIRGMERQGRAWYVQTDIEKYFASIAHALAKQVIMRTVKCPLVLKFLFALIDTMSPNELLGRDLNSTGLTIGDLANQWLANLVGNELDQVIKREWRVKRYVRYMDDMVMIFSSRAECVYWLGRMDRLLQQNGFAFSGWTIQPTHRGINFVGYRIFSTHLLLRKRFIKAVAKRIKSMNRQLQDGTLDIKKARARVNSWLAHAGHANSETIMRRLLSKLDARLLPETNATNISSCSCKTPNYKT